MMRKRKGEGYKGKSTLRKSTRRGSSKRKDRRKCKTRTRVRRLPSSPNSLSSLGSWSLVSRRV